MIKTFVGDRAPSLTDTLKVDGRVFDVPGGSTIKLYMRPLNSATLKINGATVTYTGAGGVQYDWDADDLNTAGVFVAWWVVELAGSVLMTSDKFVVMVKDHTTLGTTRVDLDTIRDFVETDLDDLSLALILDEARSTVEGRFGTDASMTVTTPGGHDIIRLQRPALTITSIVELNELNQSLWTLTPADYLLLHGGRIIQRLAGGTYASSLWMPYVTVTYMPVAEVDTRDRVIVDLVKLACRYEAVSTESVGDVRVQMGGTDRTMYMNEREQLLRGITNNRGFRFA